MELIHLYGIQPHIFFTNIDPTKISLMCIGIIKSQILT